MSCVWTRALRSMISRPLPTSSGFTMAPRRSTWAQPRMAFSGVRNSCESVARNSSFVRRCVRPPYAQAPVAFQQLGAPVHAPPGFQRPVSESGQHLVEHVRELSKFIVAVLAGPNGIIPGPRNLRAVRASSATGLAKMPRMRIASRNATSVASVATAMDTSRCDTRVRSIRSCRRRLARFQSHALFIKDGVGDDQPVIDDALAGPVQCKTGSREAMGASYSANTWPSGLNTRAAQISGTLFNVATLPPLIWDRQ